VGVVGVLGGLELSEPWPRRGPLALRCSGGGLECWAGCVWAGAAGRGDFAALESNKKTKITEKLKMLGAVLVLFLLKSKLMMLPSK